MKKSLVIAIALSITACGGGGGGSPESRPVGTASGIAHDAPIINGTVTAYAYDNGTRGEVLGTTTTDNIGNYSLSLDSPDRPVLMEVTGGRYIEEATNRSVNLQDGDALTGLVFYETGADITLQLTHYTTWANCLAEYLINVENSTVGDAISESREIMADIADVPITTVPPVDITQEINQTNVLTTGHRYGFTLAGISELTRKIAEDNGLAPHVMPQTTSIFFSRRVCDDIRADGLMDGRVAPTPANPDGRVSIGTVDIGPEHYRTELAQAILAIVQNPANRTGITIEDILPHANAISVNDNTLFAGVPTQPVDIDGPIINALATTAAAYAGLQVFDFGVSDPIGVSSARFFVDGVFLTETPADDAAIELNTALFDDGIHTITVIASDVLGNETTQDFDYQFTNTGPGVSFTSSNLTNEDDFTVTGTVMPQQGVTIDRVEIHHTREVTTDIGNATVTREETAVIVANLSADETQWNASLELVAGRNDLEAFVFDDIGNSTSIGSFVDLDQASPQIIPGILSARFSLLDGDIDNCFLGDLNDRTGLETPVCLQVDRTSLNGMPISSNLRNDGFVVLTGTIRDPQAVGVFTNNEDLVFEYRYIRDNELIIDWTTAPRDIPEISVFDFPLVTELLGDSFFQVTTDGQHRIEFRVTDLAGNSTVVDYRLRLDVLTPPLEFAVSLRNVDALQVPFEQRSVWSGQNVFVDYTFENTFNNGVYVRLAPGNDHTLQRSYDSVFREHLVQRFISEIWRSGLLNTGVLIDQVERVDGDFDNPTSLGFLQRPDDIPDGAPFNVLTDDVPANANFVEVPTFCGAAGASTQPDSLGVRRYRDYRVIIEGNESYLCSHTTPGGFVFPDGFTLNTYSVRRGNVFQSVEGHPRNDVSSIDEQFPVFNAIRVVSLTTGNEIFPQDGWYFTNPGERVRITKELTVPNITTFNDTVIADDPEGVTFDQGNPNRLDSSLVLSIDQNLSIDQAIDPGSFAALENVSALRVELTDGAIEFSTER